MGHFTPAAMRSVRAAAVTGASPRPMISAPTIMRSMQMIGVQRRALLMRYPTDVVLAAFASAITFSISACFTARLHLATT